MPKTEQEKAAIRAEVEARRQPDKDRTAHDAARGKPKMTLSDLSREIPTEEQLDNYINILTDEPSDRSMAIMVASLVEQALYVAICSHIADPGDAIRNSWFEGDNAPFRTFSAKIKLGRALAIYADKMEARLIIIKNVRNVFAHRSTPIDFNHPTVAEEVAKLKTRPTQKGGRLGYGAAAFSIARLLITNAFDHAGKPMTISFP